MPAPSGSTPVYGFPYLLESDVPDIATATQDLAQAVETEIEAVVGQVNGTVAAGVPLAGTYTGQDIITQYVYWAGTSNAQGNIAVSFPNAFPHGVLFVEHAIMSGSGDANLYLKATYIGSVSTTGLQVSCWQITASGVAAAQDSTTVSGYFKVTGF